MERGATRPEAGVVKLRGRATNVKQRQKVMITRLGVHGPRSNGGNEIKPQRAADPLSLTLEKLRNVNETYRGRLSGGVEPASRYAML